MPDLRAGLTLAIHDELDAALSRIGHCVGQLTDDQVWWRPKPEMNSVGNLVLHLTGNVTQLIVAGVGAAPDHRDRPAEFAARGGVSREALMRGLADAVNRAKAAVAAASDESLCGPIPVKQYDWTGLQAVVRSVAHFRGHTQEIIHMTRELLGDQYQFAGPK